MKITNWVKPIRLRAKSVADLKQSRKDHEMATALLRDEYKSIQQYIQQFSNVRKQSNFQFIPKPSIAIKRDYELGRLTNYESVNLEQLMSKMNVLQSKTQAVSITSLGKINLAKSGKLLPYEQRREPLDEQKYLQYLTLTNFRSNQKSAQRKRLTRRSESASQLKPMFSLKEDKRFQLLIPQYQVSKSQIANKILLRSKEQKEEADQIASRLHNLVSRVVLDKALLAQSAKVTLKHQDQQISMLSINKLKVHRKRVRFMQRQLQSLSSESSDSQAKRRKQELGSKDSLGLGLQPPVKPGEMGGQAKDPFLKKMQLLKKMRSGQIKAWH